MTQDGKGSGENPYKNIDPIYGKEKWENEHGEQAAQKPTYGSFPGFTGTHRGIEFVFAESPSNIERTRVTHKNNGQKKKNPDKLVQKFLKKTEPILENFIQKYNNKDFTDINLFKPFNDDVKEYFV